MRRRDLVALSFLFVSSAVAFWHGVANSQSPGNAQKSQAFVNTIGVVTHLPYTSGPYNNISGVLAALNNLGIGIIREGWLATTLPNQGNYNTLAAAGIKFDMLFNYTTYCPETATNVMATALPLLDTFQETYPGAIVYTEGPNEVNAFAVCYVDQFATSAATATGSSPLLGTNATLHFSPTPPGIQVLGKPVTINYIAPGGLNTTVSDVNAPGPIDPGNCFATAGATTTQSCTLTINNASELLLTEIVENGGPVTGCTDTLSLSWSKRIAQNIGGSFPTSYAEEWYASGPTSGSFPMTDTITCTQTTSNSYFNISAFGIPGANLSTPFDGSAVGGATDPISITTSHANTVVLGNFYGGTVCPVADAGFGTIAGCGEYQLVIYQGFSSTQSGLAVGTSSATETYANIADAVVMLAAPNQPAITSGATIWATSPTSVVLNGNVIGGGVGNGDIIQFNNSGVAAAYSWQQFIYATTHADPHLAGVKVLEFTDPGAIQAVAGSADIMNAHLYPNAGLQPAAYYTNVVPAKNYSGLTGGMVITETGYANDVDLASQAVMDVNTLLDGFHNGFLQVFLYELYDESASNVCTNGCFGLYDFSGVIKPSGTAVHNLTTILADSGSQAFTPGTLNYSITGLPLPYVSAMPIPNSSPATPNQGGYSFLLQKSNGHYFIVVWNEPPIYDESTSSDIPVTPLSIPVTLGQTCSTVNVYDPIVQSTPISTASSASSVTLSLGADPNIVECVP